MSSSGKPAMWAYIIILSLTVFAIWIFFFKAEMRRSTSDSQPAGNQSLSEILSDFKDSIGQGASLINQIREEAGQLDLSQEPQATSTQLTDQQKEALVDKIKEKLENN